MTTYSSTQMALPMCRETKEPNPLSLLPPAFHFYKVNALSSGD